MTDPTDFDDEARRLTRDLRASAERVPLTASMPDFGSRNAERSERHVAVELLVASLIAVAVVTLILALPRLKHAAPTTARPPAPAVSFAATPTPTPVPGIHSTISAGGPLALFWTSSAADGSVTLAALSYSGTDAGELVIPPSPTGYDIAPDGTMVLDGDQIITVSGTVLGTISERFGQLPIWADDSQHLCGVTTSGGPSANGTLVEFDTNGHARTVASFGPIALAVGGWQVLSCSPTANRALVLQENAQDATLFLVQLSPGRVIAARPTGSASWGTPVASHDGSIVALNQPSGVTIRNSTTWAVLGHVVRWGSQGGSPLIGAAVNISWDGSRVIVDGGGAGGGFHPQWMVDWATGRTLLTNTGAQGQAIRVTGFDNGIPLISGQGFLLPPGAVAADPAAAYLLEANGSLMNLPG